MGKNKTQLHHGKQFCQFTPRQPIPNVPIRPQEWKLDPDVRIKHDDFCTIASECEHESTIVDTDYENAAAPNSPEVVILSDFPADEMCITPVTA